MTCHCCKFSNSRGEPVLASWRSERFAASHITRRITTAKDVTHKYVKQMKQPHHTICIYVYIYIYMYIYIYIRIYCVAFLPIKTPVPEFQGGPGDTGAVRSGDWPRKRWIGERLNGPKPWTMGINDLRIYMCSVRDLHLPTVSIV